MVTELYPRVYL
uniref:Uncharacterized protein n=1 Tax=Anguilla anguilla TaxID=7936 RepID=A0A0E9TSX3_ANGAN